MTKTKNITDLLLIYSGMGLKKILKLTAELKKAYFSDIAQKKGKKHRFPPF